MSLYLICVLLAFVWRRRWRHKGPFVPSALSVNNFRWNWDKESPKAPLWWHWTPKLTCMRLHLPSSNHDLRGFICSWSRGQSCFWTLPNERVYHSRRLDGKIAMVSDFWWPCSHLLAELLTKNQTQLLGHWPDFWGHRLGGGLKFGYQSLHFVTADMPVFFVKR